MEDLKTLLVEHYGARFEPELIEEINKLAIYKEVKANETLIEIGDTVSSIPLLLNGAIKILRDDDDGNELLLYFLEKGDTCAMTLTCCMGYSHSQIRAIAEVDTQLVFVPVQMLEKWLSYKTWRDFVFESYNDRLYEMLDAIDSLAFMNLNERLYKYLVNKSSVTHSKSITLSHQEIAYELNTSRVVISRLLKQLEKEGKVTLHRHRLELM